MPAVIAKRRRQPRPPIRKRSRRNPQDPNSQNRTSILPPSLRRRLDALHIPTPQDLLDPPSQPPAPRPSHRPTAQIPPSSNADPRPNAEAARNGASVEVVLSQEDMGLRELRGGIESLSRDAEASVDLGPFRSSQMSEGLAAVLGSRIPDDRDMPCGRRVWRSLMDELEAAATGTDSQ